MSHKDPRAGESRLPCADVQLGPTVLPLFRLFPSVSLCACSMLSVISKPGAGPRFHVRFSDLCLASLVNLTTPSREELHRELHEMSAQKRVDEP